MAIDTKAVGAEREAPSSRRSSASGRALSEQSTSVTAASPRDVTSLFSGDVRLLAVVEESGVVRNFVVHEGVLDKLPYFANREGAWQAHDGQAEKMYLPPNCTHSSFGAVLSRLYCLDFHWSPADWARVLGAEITSAYGALMLAKMLLAVDLVEELLIAVFKMASEPVNLRWLKDTVSGLDLPELEDLCTDPGFEPLEAEVLRDAAISAMNGPATAHLLFKAILTRHGVTQLGPEGLKSLVSVLQGHESYLTRGRPRCPSYAWYYYRAPAEEADRRVTYCDFVRPLRIPVEGFDMVWQLIHAEVQREPALFVNAISVFQALQWLECDVSANRHGQESLAGSRRLRNQLEAASKQAIRRAYASFLHLGLRLQDRGQITGNDFMKAFSCGALTSAQSPEGLGGGRSRNLLYFVPGARQTVINYVDGIDMIADIVSGVDSGIRESVLQMFLPAFVNSQWGFSARAVCSFSTEQQISCVEKCSKSWLTMEVCEVLQGEARSAARTKLAACVGRLSKGQRDILRGGLVTSRES